MFDSNFFQRLCEIGGYKDINCPVGGEIIMVDLVTLDISCGPDDGRCPGAFSVGCDIETTTSTSTTTTTTTTATTASSSADSKWVSLFLMTASVSIFLVPFV